MLEALMLFVIETPGVTRDALIEKYTPVLQLVEIFKLLEMLEEIGCLQPTYLQRSHRSQYQIVAEDLGKETEVFRPTPGCIVKLGQFVTQLTSGLRSELEKE